MGKIAMRDIIAEALQYYTASSSHRNTFRILFRMKDRINSRMLQLAAAQALKRYPYYAVRCVTDGREYLLEPNDEQLVVRCTPDPVDLGGEDSNGYLLAVSYWEDVIWINVFHGLADGAGIMEFGRTLLYYYCLERYDANLSSDGIRVNDGPVPEEEWGNPYVKIMSGERELPDEKDILIKLKADTSVSPLNIFEDPRITVGEPWYWHIRISEKQLMEYCRAQDGTPGVVISLLMSRAIDRLNPDNEHPIVTGMAVSLRGALEAPLYKGSPLTLAYLPYSGKIKEKSFDFQATISRGRLLLAVDKERLQAGIKSSSRLYAALDRCPTVEAKRQLANEVVARYMGASTFQVSYMGPSRLAAIEPYVVETEPQNDGNGLTIEIMASHGFFFLEIVQLWKEDLYIQAFLDELTAQGIEFERLDSGIHKVPDIVLPDGSEN